MSSRETRLETISSANNTDASSVEDNSQSLNMIPRDARTREDSLFIDDSPSPGALSSDDESAVSQRFPVTARSLISDTASSLPKNSSAIEPVGMALPPDKTVVAAKKKTGRSQPKKKQLYHTPRGQENAEKKAKDKEGGCSKATKRKVGDAIDAIGSPFKRHRIAGEALDHEKLPCASPCSPVHVRLFIPSVSTQHYLWASGHFILLIASIRYFIAWLIFKAISAWWFKASFTGALISYAIVCHKSLGSPQPNMAYVRRALLDENVQYFLLAIYWWSSRKPIAITLLPYMIFSLFHALTFTRTTLFPQFLPPGPPATAGGAPGPHPLAKKLQAWVKGHIANYDSAMKVVAYTELVIFVRVGAITFQNALLAPLIFAHFLRQPYYQSVFTRDAITKTTAMLGGYVRKANNPSVSQIYDKTKMFIGRWVGSAIIEQNPNPQPARR
ncbi:hypothetical protein NP233_g10452 [Leucocoprinus birnbaumii]|uniref:Endoplasmic reticulum protein n=1 Tax=Leucocoprinus birnbaumii TaxID=56174 RepID=A0AAD5YRW1_9AGAR|nr:hypothetical protein NP233_g10452 [Leucocoprinus birnbaumii]